MKKHIGLAVGICLLISASFLASAQTVAVRFDPAQCKVQWTLADVLHVVHGTFRFGSGNIVFNTQTGAAFGLFTVNENTGHSDSNTRDARMKKSVLKTSEYPTATFRPMRVSGKFNANGSSTLAVDGIFHLYGADHPLHLNFQVNAADNQVTATTEFAIPYVAWGMHDPSTLFLRVGKSVQMEIDAKGTIETSSHH
ncbi:MAG: YceI family protein [Acidobacteriaceae bacterium]